MHEALLKVYGSGRASRASARLVALVRCLPLPRRLEDQQLDGCISAFIIHRIKVMHFSKSSYLEPAIAGNKVTLSQSCRAFLLVSVSETQIKLNRIDMPS